MIEDIIWRYYDTAKGGNYSENWVDTLRMVQVPEALCHFAIDAFEAEAYQHLENGTKGEYQDLIDTASALRAFVDYYDYTVEDYIDLITLHGYVVAVSYFMPEYHIQVDILNETVEHNLNQKKPKILENYLVKSDTLIDGLMFAFDLIKNAPDMTVKYVRDKIRTLNEQYNDALDNRDWFGCDYISEENDKYRALLRRLINEGG